MNLDINGKTQFVEYIGGSISEVPGDIIYNSNT